jgi:hypothetical protein
MVTTFLRPTDVDTGTQVKRTFSVFRSCMLKWRIESREFKLSTYSVSRVVRATYIVYN